MKRERPVGAFAPRGGGAANDRRADGPRLGGRVVRRHGQDGVQVGRALPGPRPRRLRGPLLEAPTPGPATAKGRLGVRARLRRRRLAHRLRPAPRREAEGRRRVPEGLCGLPRAGPGRRPPGDPTGNGPCHASKAFAAACKALGVRHVRTKPYTPKTNGRPGASSRRPCGNGTALGPARRRTSAPPTFRRGCPCTAGAGHAPLWARGRPSSAACGWIGTKPLMHHTRWCRELKPRRSGARRSIRGHRPARAGHDAADRALCGGVGSLAAESHIS